MIEVAIVSVFETLSSLLTERGQDLDDDEASLELPFGKYLRAAVERLKYVGFTPKSLFLCILGFDGLNPEVHFSPAERSG